MRNILIINNDLDLGGIQKSLIEFLRTLVDSDAFNIDLMIWQKEGPLQQMVPEKVQIIYQKYPTTLNDVITEKNRLVKMQLLFQFLHFQFCSRVMKKPWLYYPKTSKHYDIVISYTHNGFPRFFAIDNVSANKKFLWFHHGSYSSTKAEKNLDAEYYKKFAQIITVSSANKKMLAEVFPELSEKMVVVPNIINASEIIAKAAAPVHDITESATAYSFVTVSRFSEEKGLDLAVRIASELKRRGLQFRWYFIGAGDQLTAIQHLAETENVTDVCIFAGSKQNPYPYIKYADVYIQSSYVEAHPITINEALVLKKLIVSTDIPSIRAALHDGKLGILCKPEAAIFADEIMNLLQDDLRQKSLMDAVELHEINNEAAHIGINELLQLSSHPN